MKRSHSLGELQLAIMRILWQQGEATVAEVHSSLLKERGLAPTTVATMLVKMEKKGVVAHRSEGRKFVYHPTVSEEQVRRSMVDELTERVFEGNATALVAHLVTEQEIDADELERLKQLIRHHEENEER